MRNDQLATANMAYASKMNKACRELTGAPLCAAVSAANNDRNLAEVKWLLEMALARMNANEPENAVWRLADAAGLLRAALPQKPGESLIGRDEPTGRSFMLPTPQEN